MQELLWQPGQQYRKIVEANRLFYRQTSATYEKTCDVSPVHQRMLEEELDAVTRELPSGSLVLDACGGSGNVALKLLRRGFDVTVVDISQELLDIFRCKSAAHGFRCQSVCAEIGEYLASPGTKFDLIIFSSALHHLEDFRGVLSLAYERLKPGGLLFTIFDPTATRSHSSATRLVLLVDYVLSKILWETGDLPCALVRRFRRLVFHQSVLDKSDAILSSANLGLLAEYHVEQGIDDLSLVEELKWVGFEVVWHKRIADCWFGMMRRLLEAVGGEATTFQLLMRKAVTHGAANKDSC